MEDKFVSVYLRGFAYWDDVIGRTLDKVFFLVVQGFEQTTDLDTHALCALHFGECFREDIDNVSGKHRQDRLVRLRTAETGGEHAFEVIDMLVADVALNLAEDRVASRGGESVGFHQVQAVG